jgi:hypothetical protein
MINTFFDFLVYAFAVFGFLMFTIMAIMFAFRFTVAFALKRKDRRERDFR